MKQQIVMFILIVIFNVSAIAQDNRIRFRSITSAGVLHGGSRDSWQLQTINGIAYKTFSAGVGVGLDYYYSKTVPLFLDIRKGLLNRKNFPFVYTDAGVNLHTEKQYVDPFQQIRFYSRLYYDVGAGYSWQISRKAKLLLSLGYSEKKLQEVRSTPTFYQNYEYTFRRLSLKAGIAF